MEVFDSPSHSYPSDAMWCHLRPKIRDDPGQQCSHRPGSVQLAKVPATCRQVSAAGDALEVMRVGTSPLRANASPATLRVCSLADGPGIPSSGCPSRMLLPSSL